MMTTPVSRVRGTLGFLKIHCHEQELQIAGKHVTQFVHDMCFGSTSCGYHFCIALGALNGSTEDLRPRGVQG